MKFLLKTLLGLVVLVFVLAVCAVGLVIWGFPKLAPKVIDSWIENRTGFSSNINSVDLKIFSGSFDAEGITLVNPPYYQNKNFMQIKQIFVKFEPRSAYKHRAVFDYVLIDIDRITWVKNAQGSINLIEFFDKLTKKEKPSSVKKLAAEARAKVKEFDLDDNEDDYIIKKLVIKVGGMDMVGFVSENDAHNFSIDYSKEFTDVTDVESIVQQLIADFSTNGALNLAQSLLGLPVEAGALKSKIMDGVQKGVEKAFRLLQKESK